MSLFFFLQSPFHASNVGNTLKDSFCRWQYTDPTVQSYEHDVAVLLTRNKICEPSGRSCGILGEQYMQRLHIYDTTCFGCIHVHYNDDTVWHAQCHWCWNTQYPQHFLNQWSCYTKLWWILLLHRQNSPWNFYMLEKPLQNIFPFHLILKCTLRVLFSIHLCKY